jgi:hypothetical protein
MRLVRGSAIHLFILVPLVLLLLQTGMVLLHHHFDDTYYDHGDHLHKLSALVTCPGKITGQNDRNKLTTAEISPSRSDLVPPSPALPHIKLAAPIYPVIATHPASSLHERASPIYFQEFQ